MGKLQEQSGWVSGGTGENNIKHENFGKCDLQGKAGEEKPGQGLGNSPLVHKEKLQQSNQVFLCIPCVVDSARSRKNFLMEKHLGAGRASLERQWNLQCQKCAERVETGAVSAAHLESWRKAWRREPNYQSKIVFFYHFLTYLTYHFLTYLTHTGDNDDFYMFLRQLFSSAWSPCFILPIANMFWNT